MVDNTSIDRPTVEETAHIDRLNTPITEGDLCSRPWVSKPTRKSTKTKFIGHDHVHEHRHFHHIIRVPAIAVSKESTSPVIEEALAVWRGTAVPVTVSEAVESRRKRFGLRQVVVVGPTKRKPDFVT